MNTAVGTVHTITATINAQRIATWKCDCGAQDWLCVDYADLTAAAQMHAPSIEPVRLTIA